LTDIVILLKQKNIKKIVKKCCKFACENKHPPKALAYKCIFIGYIKLYKLFLSHMTHSQSAISLPVAAAQGEKIFCEIPRAYAQ
jgi:hypothetical protein